MTNAGRASWQREQPAETPTREKTWCIQGDSDGPAGRARRHRCGSRSVGVPCDLKDHPEVVVLAQAARNKDCRLRASHSSGGWVLGRSLVLVDRQWPPLCVLFLFSQVTDPIMRALPSYCGITGKSQHRGSQGFNRRRCMGRGEGERHNRRAL